MRITLCPNYSGRISSSPGYAMAGLLVAIAIMGILMTMLLPYWQTVARREKEAELIFRGEQYVRAIELYQRQFPGAYPDDLDFLIEQRFLRRAYADPMTGGPFEILTQGTVGITPTQASPFQETPSDNQSTFSTNRQPDQVNPQIAPNDGFNGLNRRDTNSTFEGLGIIGVASRSSENSMRSYNDRTRYNEWLFVYLPQAAQPGEAARPQDGPENSQSEFSGSSSRFGASNGGSDNLTQPQMAR